MLASWWNYLKYAVTHIHYVRKACWRVSRQLKQPIITQVLDDLKPRIYIGNDVFLDVTPGQIWWQGLTHDLSRFRPSEFLPYAAAHGGGHVKRDPKTGSYSGAAASETPIELARERAMMWHWYRNRHHWEHWAIVLPTTHGKYVCENTSDFRQIVLNTQILEDNAPDVKLINIPDRYLLEMACDWWGASMTQGMHGRIWSRYQLTKQNMHMSDENRKTFEACLQYVERTMNGTLYEDSNTEVAGNQ